jgi:hypothetical protein
LSEKRDLLTFNQQGVAIEALKALKPFGNRQRFFASPAAAYQALMAALTAWDIAYDGATASAAPAPAKEPPAHRKITIPYGYMFDALADELTGHGYKVKRV